MTPEKPIEGSRFGLLGYPGAPQPRKGVLGHLWAFGSLLAPKALPGPSERAKLGVLVIRGMADETARVYRGAGWRGGVAGSGVGATTSDASDRLRRYWFGTEFGRLGRRIPQGIE
jgi:hypothetical protein